MMLDVTSRMKRGVVLKGADRSLEESKQGMPRPGIRFEIEWETNVGC
jgi:hypothetical protein